MNVGWVYSQFYSGVIFQVAVDVVRKKKTVSEILATGGGYDNLVRGTTLGPGSVAERPNLDKLMNRLRV